MACSGACGTHFEAASCATVAGDALRAASVAAGAGGHTLADQGVAGYMDGMNTRSEVLAALALGATLVCGCHLPSRTAGTASVPLGRMTVITEDEIARMSVQTAWDVVRARAPYLTTNPLRIQGQRSANSDETPLLVVDGVRATDIGYLSEIPATQVRTIRILDAEAAEPLYGLVAAGGAIIVETKQGR